MKLKMKHVVDMPMPRDLGNQKVKVCGARNPNMQSMRCTDPHWMGEHTWHTGATGWQWCGCGMDHHHSLKCSGGAK